MQKSHHEARAIDLDVQLKVLNKAREISEALESPYEKTVALIGPCAMTNHPVELLDEGSRIAELNEDGLVTVQRMPVWKPRTNPGKDWEGLETALVEMRDGKGYAMPATALKGMSAALNILAESAGQHGGAAIELKNVQHLDRYKQLISLGWSGSRSVEDKEQQLAVAVRDPKLPYLIKNGMDGSIDLAISAVERINAERDQTINPAPAMLIFRGGEELTTPELWKQACIEAIHRTDGRVVIDVAHGSEMAHDPSGDFKKTVEGQIAAMQAVIELAKEGHISAGIMVEASDLATPTDPVMPLQIALNGVRELHDIKLQKLSEIAAKA